MKIQLQPNVVNDVTALTGLDGVPSLYFQYLNSNDETVKIFFGVSDSPITVASSSSADCFMHCDPDSIQSTKQIKVPYQNRIYAWYKSTATSPVNLIVTSKQVADVGYADDSFASISTGEFGSPTSRLRTDQQQTSFEENAQFRFFDDLSDQTEYGGTNESIPANQVLVYKFTASNPVNIQSRILNLVQGGRKYLVFPADGNETITGGTFEDVSDQIFPVNGNLREGLAAHPATGVTVEKRRATSFTTTSKARTGTSSKTDGNANRASSTYSPDGQRAGVAGSQSFYLVLFDVDGTNATEMLFTVAYEERFGE